MKIYNTKYALTQGILEQEGRLASGGMVKVGQYTFLHGEGKEWHRSIEPAIARAEIMRDLKIISLKKSLKRIKGLKF